MSVAEKRVTKLEQALTPSQAVLAFLAMDVAGTSSGAYQAALLERPLAASGFVRLTEQVAQAAQQAQRSEPNAIVVARRVRQAVRDVAFLHALLLGVNERLLAEHRLRWYQLAVLAAELAAPLRQLTAGHPPGPVALERASGIAVEVHASVQAVAVVATRYFSGLEIRFADVAEDQTTQLEALASAFALYEEAAGLVAEDAPASPRARRRRSPPVTPAYPPLDHPAIAHAAATIGAEWAEGWIALAKAEAHRFVGETDQGWTLLGGAQP